MNPEELSYIERVIYRQTVISDLIINDVEVEFIKSALTHASTEQLEGLLSGILKLKIQYPERFYIE